MTQVKGKLNAVVSVFKVEGENILYYKYRGKYYPLRIVTEDEAKEDGSDMLTLHEAPCMYKAVAVTQNMYAPLFKKQLKEMKKENKRFVQLIKFSF